MNASLRAALREDASVRLAEPEIWSALPPDAAPAHYDDFGATYDRVVSHPLYTRLAWGSRIEREYAFAARALASADEGRVLDAGCGSLCFTAGAHLASTRETLLLDLSLGMLRLARDRLIARAGRVPEHLALLQADAITPPLRDGAFRTVLCPGILHLFADPQPLLRRLDALCEPGGSIFLTCLVTDRAFGRAYLRLLVRAGEIGLFSDAASLRELVERATGRPTRCERAGNLAYLECGPRPAARGA
jgi:ubiquinone/menaquinone biosynthesis C-methylase UbiE